jgi:hypothetical protein
MFATAPACSAAVMVKFTVPTSLARGVPDNVRLLSSSDSQGGLPINEYRRPSDADEKFVGANWKLNGVPTRATGGYCIFSGVLHLR